MLTIKLVNDSKTFEVQLDHPDIPGKFLVHLENAGMQGQVLAEYKKKIDEVRIHDR